MRSLIFAGGLGLLAASSPSAQEITVHPPLPLAADQGVALVFEGGRRAECVRDRAGRWRTRLGPGLAGRGFSVVRTPGDVAETHARGGAIPPRVVPVRGGPAHLFPAGWADGALPAYPHRRGLHQDLVFPGSPRAPAPRPVRVHLPRAYLTRPDRRFPVLYVLDGQNAFDGATSYGGAEWNLDEVAQALEAEGVPPFIMVGVDNGLGRRLHEYTFTPDPQHGGGGAAEHLAYLLEDIEPFVAARFRIDPTRRRLIGSSLGGLFGLYAALQAGGEFEAVAALSPSLWWAGEAIRRLPAGAARPRVWVDMGGREGEHSVRQLGAMKARLEDLGWGPEALRTSVLLGGRHTESAWASRAAAVLRFLAASPADGGAGPANGAAR